MARLDRIEERAARRKLPLAFSNELYTLREHMPWCAAACAHLRKPPRT
jgi:hypothetical protein